MNCPSTLACLEAQGASRSEDPDFAGLYVSDDLLQGHVRDEVPSRLILGRKIFGTNNTLGCQDFAAQFIYV